MQSTSIVQICQSFQGLAYQRSNNRFRKAAVLFQASSDTPSGNILQKNTESTIRSLIAKVLDNVGVIEVFKSLYLRIQCIHHALGTVVISVAYASRDFHLFDGKHFASRCVQSEIDASIRSFPYQFAFNPFKCSYNLASPKRNRYVFVRGDLRLE